MEYFPYGESKVVVAWRTVPPGRGRISAVFQPGEAADKPPTVS